MTVKELIEELKKYDEDTEIIVKERLHHFHYDILNIRKYAIPETEMGKKYNVPVVLIEY